MSEDFTLQLPFKCRAKIRYRQEDQACTIVDYDGERVHVVFDESQKAITIRQSIVFYTTLEGREVCLGGGMIERRGETHYEKQK